MGVDREPNGLGVLHELKELRYPRIYYGMMFDWSSKKASPNAGIHISPSRRKVMLDDLRYAVRMGFVHIHDEPLLDQLQSMILVFQHGGERVGRHGSRILDDLVMALAMAWFMHRQTSLVTTEDMESKTRAFVDPSRPRLVTADGYHVPGSGPQQSEGSMYEDW